MTQGVVRWSMTHPECTRLEGLHCAITIESPAPGVIVITIAGTDVGELGQRPFLALAPLLLQSDRTELFIDARRARGPSIDVSSDWAQWLSVNRAKLIHVSMLTASRFVQLSAGFVRTFADLEDLMRLYADDRVFEGALSNALANAAARAQFNANSARREAIPVREIHADPTSPNRKLH